LHPTPRNEGHRLQPLGLGVNRLTELKCKEVLVRSGEEGEAGGVGSLDGPLSLLVEVTTHNSQKKTKKGRYSSGNRKSKAYPRGAEK